MKIEKEKRKVRIFCNDDSLIEGFVHINPGERILDFINDPRENFIAVTDVKIYYSKKPHYLKLNSKLEKESIILNKAVIKSIEEI